MSRSLKVLLGILGGVVLVLVLTTVYTGSGFFGSGPMMGRGGMMGGWGAFGMGWMMLFPLLFFGGLIALIVWAVTQLASGGHAAGSAVGVHEQSAQEILQQRFARGEIDAEEYEERRRVLNEQYRREQASQ